jgi:hypothetical protein
VETTIFETSFAARIQCNEGARFGGLSRSKASVGELDRLDPQLIRQHRLVLPNLVDHRLGFLALEEELNDLLGLGADDAVEEHAVRIIRASTKSGSRPAT